MRRFYDRVAAVAVEGGFTVDLDGRTVRTPARRKLVLPARRLARAIAMEWANQEAEIRPRTMPLTRLANSALDGTAQNRGRIVDEVAAYGETDLVCYRAEAPPELVERQTRAWQPLLDWVRERHGAPLATVTGILHAPQPSEAVAAIRDVVAGFDDFRLTGLHAAVSVSGSVVIGLALAAGRLDAEAAWQASALDETFQIERWGEDAMATERRAGARVELRAAAEFLAGLE